jgi:hypothetical protein
MPKIFKYTPTVFIAFFAILIGVGTVYPSIAATQVTSEDAYGETEYYNETNVKTSSTGNSGVSEAYAADPANAANLWDAAKVYTGVGRSFSEAVANYTDLERNFWIETLFNKDIILDLVNMFLFQEKTETAINRAANDELILPEVAYNKNQVNELGVLPGGAAGAVSYTYSYIYNESPQPTNFALFVNDVSSDTLFGTPAYAASSLEGTLFESLVFGTWKVTRNIALSLLGVMLAITAIMIIFRQKISPQAVVTIYNILPKIPLVIVLIVLSYPIVAVAISAIPQLILLVIGSTYNVYKDILEIWMTGVLGDVTNVFEFVTKIIHLAISSPLKIMSVLDAGSMSTYFSVAALCFAVFLMFIVGMWNFAKAYGSLIVATILSPIIILYALLPGKGVLMTNLGKRMIADILTIPLILLVVLLGAVVLAMPVGYGGSSGLPAFAWGITYFTAIIKSFIGLWIMWQSRKVRKSLSEGLGVVGLFGGGGAPQQRR